MLALTIQPPGRLWALWSVLAAAVLVAGCARTPLANLELGDDPAALMLEDLIARERPSRLKARTPAPQRRTVRYELDGRRQEADLYRPGGGLTPLASLVIVPGLSRDGKDDHRLVALASTLARMRFLVLVPDIPEFRNLRLHEAAVGRIAGAVRHLTETSTVPASERLGIGAISYGVGPALVAATRPDIRERVRFIVSIGGYHDVEALIRYFTTGRVTPVQVDGYELDRHLVPHPGERWMFAFSNADLLERRADREAVTQFAEDKLLKPRRMRGRSPPRDVGPDAEALLRLVTNMQPERVAPLIAALPEPVRGRIRALNPAAHDLSALDARLILVHGLEDAIIPPTESVALTRAVPPGQARLFLVEGLSHVSFGMFFDDDETLLRAITAFLAERHR